VKIKHMKKINLHVMPIGNPPIDGNLDVMMNAKS
jgi:hypothetical protein